MFFLPPVTLLKSFPALVFESEGESSSSEQIDPVKKDTPKKNATEEVSAAEEIDESNEASHVEDGKGDNDEDEDEEEEVFVR